MKLPYQFTVRPCTIAHPPLFRADANADSQQKIVLTTVLECTWTPKLMPGKEGRELMFFADFAKTDEFWHCIELLKPGTQRTETISILKNSDGDDPPDLTVFFPSGPIGIELTDCSPITACVEKVSAAMRKGAAIPGASDAKTFQQVKEFMSRPRSFVKPRFTSLQREQETLISYLTEQIRRKDISGNDILLLAGSFMGGWPESEFATIAKELAEPRHIRFVVLVSQSRSTIV